jgi:peptidoglycan/xylan/chitin deacetylase (PgdA/CDA1 family)
VSETRTPRFSPWTALRRMLGFGGVEPRAVVLLYHRVAELDCDPWGLAVTPSHFAEHMEVLRRHFNPTTLVALTEDLVAGDVPRRATVVTFDDGYADNFTCALPLLERHEVGATFFVTSDAIGATREFWWDELERLVLRSPRLPHEIRLACGGAEYAWPIDDGDRVEDTGTAHRSWRAWESDRNSRHRAYRELYDVLFALPTAERGAAMAALADACGASLVLRATHRTTSVDELANAARHASVEIGAHSVSHPSLAALSEVDRTEEIVESKTRIERLVDREVTSFAYPFGRDCDTSAAVIAEVEAAGFRRACTTTRAAVTRSTQALEIPRIGIPDCDGGDLERLLHGYFAKAA